MIKLKRVSSLHKNDLDGCLFLIFVRDSEPP